MSARPWVPVLLVAAALACAPAPARAGRDALLVLAAASLADVGGDLRKALEGGEREVRFSYASTGTIRRQIMTGAPADVVLAADAAMLEGVREELLDEEPAVFAVGTLVLAVEKDSEARVETPEDIARLFRRIAVGDPLSVPAGQYAKEALEKLGLYETLSPRLVPSKDVRAALAALVSGNVQAAIVYRSDLTPGRRAREAFAFPEDSHRPIQYAAARVRGSEHPEDGARLIAFLGSPAGRSILTKWGFTPPPQTPAEPAPAPAPPTPEVLEGLDAPAPKPAAPAPLVLEE